MRLIVLVMGNNNLKIMEENNDRFKKIWVYTDR